MQALKIFFENFTQLWRLTLSFRAASGKTASCEQPCPASFIARSSKPSAAAIDAALSAPGSVALIEAGTGVGKTLAYLLPALQRAKPNCAHRRLHAYAGPASAAGGKRHSPGSIRLEKADPGGGGQGPGQLSLLAGFGRRAGRPLDCGRSAVCSDRPVEQRDGNRRRFRIRFHLSRLGRHSGECRYLQRPGVPLL